MSIISIAERVVLPAAAEAPEDLPREGVLERGAVRELRQLVGVRLDVEDLVLAGELGQRTRRLLEIHHGREADGHQLGVSLVEDLLVRVAGRQLDRECLRALVDSLLQAGEDPGDGLLVQPEGALGLVVQAAQARAGSSEKMTSAA